MSTTCDSCGKNTWTDSNGCSSCHAMPHWMKSHAKHLGVKVSTPKPKRRSFWDWFTGAGLIPCPDCRREVSRRADKCPGCGRPL